MEVIAQAEQEEEVTYKAMFVECQRNFTPLVYLVDGLPGRKALAAEKRLASLLANKWKR